MAPTGTNILMDIGRPKRTTYAGGSPKTWKLRQEFARVVRAMAPKERRRLGQAMEQMAEYERRLDAPLPWSTIVEMLRQAEADTARAMDEVESLSGRLRVRLEEVSGRVG